MNTFIKTGIAALAAGAALVGSAAPASAQGYYGHRYGGGDDTAVAIGAGVVGLALGAALASDHGYYRGGYYGGYYGPRYRAYPAYGYGYGYYPRGYRGYGYGYGRGYYRGGGHYRGDWHGHRGRRYP